LIHRALIIGLAVLLAFFPSDRGRKGRIVEKKKAVVLRDSSGRISSLIPAVRSVALPEDTVEVAFIGDVMMHSKQLSYPWTSFLEGIRGRLGNADLAVANMEFTLAGEPYSGYPAFSAPDGYADYVRSCGVDVFLTANNHIMDKGAKGLERTLQVYGSMDVQYTGSAADSATYEETCPLIVPVHGIRLALINFTYGTNAGRHGGWPKVSLMRRTEIASAIAKAKERKADFIIALPHWGSEYELTHGKAQEEMASWLVSQGVDAIVGAHPHVVQDSAVISGKPVYYSIGNAVSNMSAPNTQLELMVTLRFRRAADGSMEMLPPRAEYLWCSLPGTFSDNYMTLALADAYGKRSLWKNGAGYDKMIDTWRHVSSVTKIEDNFAR
jgi:poly-gamma-glutamate synthesis protein (capsule biosynthesis protein)